MKLATIKKLSMFAATVLCASALLTTGTYALFTDSIELNNHLVAGNLDITLTRTKLSYQTVDAQGMAKTESNNTPVDFSKATTDNVFGLEDTTKFCPTDYREAEFTISNSSTVAFDWYFTVLLGESVVANEFSNQLQIDVDTDVNTNGYEYTDTLTNGLSIGSSSSPLGLVKVGESADFKVKVTFVDSESNNDAAGKTVDFDICLYAVQHTGN